MRTLFCTVFLSSSLALAGNGGMVGGGRFPPPSVMLEIPELSLSLEAKLHEQGSSQILKMKPLDWLALQAAAKKNLNIAVLAEAEGEQRIEVVDAEASSNDAVILSDAEGLSVLAIPSSDD